MLPAQRHVMAIRRSRIAKLALLVTSCTGIAAAPCSNDASRVWLVDDTASASALAEEVNCSDGVFNVEWTGNIVVEREIYVGSGTSLRVAGTDPEARINGGGKNRLFTVENAYLNVSNVIISNGNATDGGAIVCEGSNMSFYNTSFINNLAVPGNGGALHVVKSSTVTLGGLTTFSSNSASKGGGAAFIGNSSSVSLRGKTSFSGNTAHDGGAMYVGNISDAFWEAETSFVDNTADFTGGAMTVYNASTVSWQAPTQFSGNSGRYGGGVHVENNSIVSWEAETVFSGNHAPDGGGGGLDVYDGSNASWSAATNFTDNHATHTGGAMQANAASVSWTAKTVFTDNTASSGGAMYVLLAATASWTGETSFLNNSANYGGALLASDYSSASWEGDTSFINNSANTSGGALSLNIGSSISWTSGTTYFMGNTALHRGGGAVYALDRSNVSWEAETAFVENSATRAGGAVLIEYGSNVSWRANTSFRNNDAGASGGAVSISSSNENSEDIPSFIVIDAPTTFVENSCRTGGGAMAIVGEIPANFTPNAMKFERNSADFGGAVFVASSEIGPQFIGARFASNSAERGGAVFLTGSGNKVTDYKFLDPTTFDQCQFHRNVAGIDGGAVETGAGQDVFTNTLFVGNVAQVGGALSLAGEASISNCTFIENTSAQDDGPAISNVGSIERIENSNFADNVFACERGNFLDFYPSENIFEIVCDECQIPCTTCDFGENSRKTPRCETELDNSESAGGKETLETLSINEGYWRATNTSRDVRECYNADACAGGPTGNDEYCKDGYRGPYCSICEAGFTSGPGYTCHSCSDATSGLVLVVVLGVLAFGAVVAFLLFMTSARSGGGGPGAVARVARIIPLQSVKIVIVAWQILTQFSEVANVTYPDVYQELLDGLDVLNFDLSWMLSTGCIFDVDFHERLIISTIAPIVCLAILGATYFFGGRDRTGWSETTLGSFRRKHLTMVILLTFLVYSSVSSVLFQMFSCDPLDDGKNYLRADYRIDCDSSRHVSFQIYAGFMIVVYTVGIPAFYATLLFWNRDVLTDDGRRETDMRIKPITSLWSPYQPQRFYYEVIECGRRIALTGVVVFIYPNTSAQISVTLVLTVFFIFVSEALAPFTSRWDSWVNRTGHAIIFLSMYVALLLKIDVSTDDPASRKMFGVILVSVNVFMIAVVIIEAVLIACALRYEEQDGPDESKGRRGVSCFFEEGSRPGSANVDDAETGANIVPRRFIEIIVPARAAHR